MESDYTLGHVPDHDPQRMREMEPFRHADGTQMGRGDAVEAPGTGPMEIIGWDAGAGMVLCADASGRVRRTDPRDLSRADGGGRDA